MKRIVPIVGLGLGAGTSAAIAMIAVAAMIFAAIRIIGADPIGYAPTGGRPFRFLLGNRFGHSRRPKTVRCGKSRPVVSATGQNDTDRRKIKLR
jgi:hypothetical protein